MHTLTIHPPNTHNTPHRFNLTIHFLNGTWPAWSAGPRFPPANNWTLSFIKVRALADASLLSVSITQGAGCVRVGLCVQQGTGGNWFAGSCLHARLSACPSACLPTRLPCPAVPRLLLARSPACPALPACLPTLPFPPLPAAGLPSFLPRLPLVHSCQKQFMPTPPWFNASLFADAGGGERAQVLERDRLPAARLCDAAERNVVLHAPVVLRGEQLSQRWPRPSPTLFNAGGPTQTDCHTLNSPLLVQAQPTHRACTRLAGGSWPGPHTFAGAPRPWPPWLS